MKICLYTPSFLPRVGGMEVVLDRLARQFQARSHQVLVLAKTPRGAFEPPSLPYEVVYYPRSRSNVWLLGPTRRSLLEAHRLRGFDIVHAHQAYPAGYVAVRAMAPLGVPVVITSHKGDIIPGGRYRERWLPRRRMCRAMKDAAAVTGVSEELQAEIDFLTGGAARSLTIPNGVDLPESPPAKAPPALAALEGKTFMLTLGRIHEYKGLDVLLEALGSLRAKGEAIPNLVIAGDGKDRPALERQAARLGLGGGVWFVGMVQGAEKDWLLHACRFFLQPSRKEGMPLTVLEAMAHGKSVIGTAVSGTVELVRDGVNGLMVPPDNAAALAGAILSLSRRASLADLEERSLAAARELSWSVIADRYIELYESCLGGTA